MSGFAVVRVAIIATFVVVLEAICQFDLVRKNLLVPPSAMATQLWALLNQRDFWTQFGGTARCIAIAFAGAVVVGFVAGVALHQFPRARRAIEPLIASWYALPFFVLYPLFIVLLGMNEAPIIVVGFLYAFMAMVTGTLSGLDRIPSVFGKVGRTYRLAKSAEALLIKLPAAAPHVFNGGKLALGYAVTGVIGSEFILSNSGLGYSIAYAYNDFHDRTMYALLLFVVLLVSGLTALLNWLERGVEYRSGSAQSSIRDGSSSLTERLLAAVIIAAVIIGLWQITYLKVGREALASPWMAFEKILSFQSNPEFLSNVTETALALGFSLLISCFGGLLFGIAIGASHSATQVLEPIFVTFYALPKVTLYPVVLLFFGIGLPAKIAFGAMYGLVPMLLITINAIRNMSPILRRTARSMRLRPLQLLTTILVPATVPEIVTGIRISFSITLLGVMIGEMFASKRGLGFMIMNSIGVNDTATLMALTVMIGIFAVIVNSLLLALDHKLHRA